MNYLPFKFSRTRISIVRPDSAEAGNSQANNYRGGNYHNLDAAKVTETLECLEARIQERFPGCGLGAVCGDLTAFARRIKRRAQLIIAPNYWLRLSVGLVVAMCLYGLVYLMSSLIVLDYKDGLSVSDKVTQAFRSIAYPKIRSEEYSEARRDVKDMAELMQAVITIVTFIAACMIFLVSIERRLKRRKILHDLHELRSFTHVIDMHQLTKLPDSARNKGPTDLVMGRPLTKTELTQYLDFCSEMLSLTSKLAAIYAQHLPDSVVISAVNDIETLTTHFSRKIWQKISIVETGHDEAPPRRMAAP